LSSPACVNILVHTLLSFFRAPPPPELSPLPLHDALRSARADRPHPPLAFHRGRGEPLQGARSGARGAALAADRGLPRQSRSTRSDRKSTRLNSSHGSISYAVFCLKKKKS